MTKEFGTAADRLKREIHRALDRIRVELNRIELLSAGLAAFGKPVPDYEPAFRHLHHVPATAFELKD